MANYAQTTKYLLRKILGTSDVKDVDEGFSFLADDIDANMAGYADGTLSARPAAGKSGRLYRTTDTTQVFMDTGSAWVEIGVSPWMPGDLKASWLTAAPAGWLLCDGSAVSRATYAALFAAVGTSAGAGNGTTTFNVPDFRGRGFVMPDGSAGRLSANDARGQSGGSETHTLTSGELPADTRVLNTSAGPSDYGAGGAFNSNPGGGAAFSVMGPYLVGGAVLMKT